MPGVLGSDERGLAEDAQGTQCNILKIPDRGCDEVEGSDSDLRGKEKQDALASCMRESSGFVKL